MLGLIALSVLPGLLLLELSGGQGGAGSRRGDGKAAAVGKPGPARDSWREHVVVTMAGDERERDEMNERVPNLGSVHLRDKARGRNDFSHI